MAQPKTDLEREAERVADELEQTADYGSDVEPHWKRVYEAQMRQWAKRLRGEL